MAAILLYKVTITEQTKLLQNKVKFLENTYKACNKENTLTGIKEFRAANISLNGIVDASLKAFETSLIN